MSRRETAEQFRNILTFGTTLWLLTQYQPFLVRICWALQLSPILRVAAAGRGLTVLSAFSPSPHFLVLFFPPLLFFFFSNLVSYYFSSAYSNPGCTLIASHASSHLILPTDLKCGPLSCQRRNVFQKGFFSLFVTLYLIKGWMIYNVMLISPVQKSDSVLYTHMHTHIYTHILWFPCGSDSKKFVCSAGDLVRWVGKIHWRREWQPTPVFLPREFHRERSLKGCSPWVCKRVRHNWATNTHILLKYSFPLWFITGYWIYFSVLYTVETCLFVLYVIVCIYHPQTSKTSLPCSAFLFRNIMYDTRCQSRFDTRYWMLGARALGRPRGMVWGGRREEGSGWGTHVYLWRIHYDIWQN